MTLPSPRAVLVLLAFGASLALWGARDVPAQVDKLRRESRLLSDLDERARRIEMWRPEPGVPAWYGQYYNGLRRYLDFFDLIREQTPEDARVGLVGVAWDPYGKYAHYFLFPRHPFVTEGREPRAAAKALRLDHLATFDPSGATAGRVERVR